MNKFLPLIYVAYSVITVVCLASNLRYSELNAVVWMLMSVILTLIFIKDIDNDNLM
jgi:hypothetical protein